VHSGYFDGYFTQALIYRLACLGWSGALCAPDFGGTADGTVEGAPKCDPALFGVACGVHGIKVLRPLAVASAPSPPAAVRSEHEAEPA
jgi:hypothetical protein